MRWRRASIGVAIAAAGLGVLAPGAADVALAQGDAESIDFDAIFKRGFERYESGDTIGAIQIWEQLLGTMGERRGYKILYNLGLAYQAAGDATRAVERFESFIQHLASQTEPVTGPLEERRQDAAARTDAIKKSHGEVIVPAPARGGPVMVTIGTSAPRLADFTAYLAPGRHRIELGSGTPDARTITIDVEAGGSTTLDTTLAAEPEPPPPTPPDTTPPAPPAPTPPDDAPEFPTAWVLIGAGLTAASVAFPVAMYFRASDAREHAEELPLGHSEYGDRKQAFGSARNDARLAWILPGALGAITVGIAAVGGMIVLTHDDEASSTGELRLQVGPLGAGAQYRF